MDPGGRLTDVRFPTRSTERIGAAGQLVTRMNETLAGCATSSGMGIELEWRPHVHDDPALREAVSLLRRDVALPADDARGRLVTSGCGRSC